MATTFGDIYQRLSERYPDPRERGRQFEPLVAQVLRTDSQYRNRFRTVWRWNEWPGRDGGDYGIDIVAEGRDGELTAIQCKCYDPEITLYAKDLATFLANTQQRFSARMVVSTVSDWSKNLLQLINRQAPPVQRLDLFGLEATMIDWDAYLEDEAAPLRERPRKEVRPHQRQALDDVFAGLKEHDRGKLIMACGTGKTFTALRAAEEIAGAGGRVLFAAPSISLVAQSLREWGQDAELPIRAFAVCSDAKVAGDDAGARTYDLPIPPTTDPAHLAAAAANDAPDRLTVVFSTYQSMAVIRDAQAKGMPAFDLVVCDEAHRTTGHTLTGEDRSAFMVVHDPEAIRARKRLYMTATPRIYGDAGKAKAEKHNVYLASMDDAAIYGPELHRLGFAASVESGLLSDYRVLVLAINERTVAREFQRHLGDPDVALDDLGRVIGCLNGLAKLDPASERFKEDPAPMRRAVAFSNTIEASKYFTKLVGTVQDEVGVADRSIAVETRHVDGKSGALRRSRELDWLRTETRIMGDRCHVLSNARCLTEGIDVPALDAVLFLQPRKSQIDVVQAVGRVMRRAENKRYGYVILPVVVPADMDPSTALDRNDVYGHVWEVLQALRSHDERFNAEINQFDLDDKGSKRIEVIGIGSPGGDEEDGTNAQATAAVQAGLALGWGEHQDAILARIVLRCGDRKYWAQWAESVADIASAHRTRINALIAGADPALAERFDAFVTALQHNLNDSISREDAAALLSQHLITRPVFDALFGGSDFTAHNPVSQVMQRMIGELEGHGLEAETRELEDFYASVRRRVEGINSAEGRQRVAAELYDRFFQVAFPRDAERLGIVYTPVEIVDCIIRSVAELLEREFGASLGDEGVHILDPFTGTGTFIVRLLQSGLISPDDLPRKYRWELHANEIMLLAYYIAAVNIENVYGDLMAAQGKQAAYESFGGIVLTDTFQLSEEGDPMDERVFPRNNARAERQRDLDIRVILGNPPWSRMQRSQSDLNPNQAYPTLDGSIEASYAAPSQAVLKNPLYDSYTRAIRWASNRVQDSADGGIVAFVTNGGFIDSVSFDGFRRAVAGEFHEIYVYNLRGAARGSGATRQREKGSVFGGGTRAAVATLLLVKRPGPVTDPAVIRYRDIGDYLSREQKLEIVGASRLEEMEWEKITPNAAGDWINQRSDRFASLHPLAPVKSQPPGETPIFEFSTNGLHSARDTWVYSSSVSSLRAQVEHAAGFFNEQIAAFARTNPAGSAAQRLAAARVFASRDDTRFSWDRASEQRLSRGQEITVDESAFRLASYRPFLRQHLYMDRALNSSVGQLPHIFPIGIERVPGIALVNKAVGDSIGVLAVDTIPDYHFGGTDGRFFPRYLPTVDEKQTNPQQAFLPKKDLRRRDNINPDALAKYRAYLGGDVTADQIFAYVYGVLHAPDYRERYNADLSRLLARIPDPADRAAFDAFSQAGQRLLDLHIGYEHTAPYPLAEQIAPGAPPEPERYHVEKMRWAGPARDPDRSRIVYNDWITLADIPNEAHDYLVGPRSALGWLIDRYQVTKDKDSGIINDVNLWGEEHGQPRYIFDLVKRVVTVSVETMRVVRGLPELREVE